jgi:VanZ family protein
VGQLGVGLSRASTRPVVAHLCAILRSFFGAVFGLEEPGLPERALRPPPDVLVGRYWLPVVAYLAIIQVLGMQKDLQVPMIIFNADKAVHTIEYGTLGFLLARAFRVTIGGFEPIKTALIAWGIGVAVGTADEIIQKFVPGRTSSVNDLLADSTGILLAQFVFLLFHRD